MGRVAFVGPLPPPLHGMAAVSRRIVDALGGVTAVDVITVIPGRGGRIRYHGGKIARALAAGPRLLRSRLRGARTFYGAVDAGIGGFYTCAFVIVARLLGMAVFLHHHNYNYLMRRTRPMAALTRCAGRDARHIVLCDRMADDLRSLYPTVEHTLVAPNGVTVPAPPVRVRRGATLRIGMLSNLTPAKGVERFLSVVDELRAGGMAVDAVLAGPAAPPALEHRLRQREASDPGTTWLGAIHGEAAKAEFFAAIDVFLFPSDMESFGLVLLEALLHGVPIVAPGHGCICLFAQSRAARILDPDGDLVEQAVAVLRTWPAPDGPALHELAREDGLRINDIAVAGQARLVRALTVGA